MRYATAAQLVNELAEAADERRLSRIVARYGRLDLVCLDELGNVQLDTAVPNCCSRSSPSLRNSGGNFEDRPTLRFCLLDIDFLLYEVSVQRGDAEFYLNGIGADRK